MKKTPILSEWSFVLPAEDVGEGAKTYTFTADEAACADLARRFDVTALAHVRAEITAERVQGGAVIRLSGTVFARVTQPCVVTLDPVDTEIIEPFTAYFGEAPKVVPFAARRSAGSKSEGEEDDLIEYETLSEEDRPEPIIGGVIDLGEVAAQFLSLAIPAYPRAANAPDLSGPEEPQEAAGAGEETSPVSSDNPFAALKEWKEGL